jgi:ABC-type xylose transport system permease subunit
VPLIQLVVILIIIGVLMYLVNQYIPMQAAIKNIINIVVTIVVVLWILTLFFPTLMTWGPRVGPR